MRSFFSMCSGLVAMKVWMRALAAGCSASAARLMSRSLARASEQTVLSLMCAAMARTQSKSPLLEAAKPDLEEELSRFTGDAAAHYVARFAREAADFGRRAGDIFARNVSEYLTEESRDVPSRLEAEEFIEGVDRLREAVDRLEARVAAAERAPGRA